MTDIFTTTAVTLGIVIAVVVVLRQRRTGRRVPPPPTTARPPAPPPPDPAARAREYAARAERGARRADAAARQAAREALASAKGWHLYNPAEHTLEREHPAGTAEFDAAAARVGFTPEERAAAREIRVWHPYYKDGLSSFIYHYHDLLDADGNVIAQRLDAEDIRE